MRAPHGARLPDGRYTAFRVVERFFQPGDEAWINRSALGLPHGSLGAEVSFRSSLHMHLRCQQMLLAGIEKALGKKPSSTFTFASSGELKLKLLAGDSA